MTEPRKDAAIRLSVVIPVLNRARMIGQAISSVRDQSADGVEIIAVDGGSTDGTQQAIATFPEVRLVAAPRSSIYEAVNIGIRLARAPLIAHLNSDDRIAAGALSRVLTTADRSAAEIIRGRALVFEAEAGGSQRPMPAWCEAIPAHLDTEEVLFGAPAINACFVRTAAYRRIGFYDESLRISADREWLLRALLSGASFENLDFPVYEYLLHPASMTISAGRGNEAAYVREHLAIAERHLAAGPPAPVARLLRAWYGHEVARLMLRDGWAARRDAVRAFRVLPTWSLRAIKPVVCTAARRLRRRFMPQPGRDSLTICSKLHNNTNRPCRNLRAKSDDLKVSLPQRVVTWDWLQLITNPRVK